MSGRGKGGKGLGKGAPRHRKVLRQHPRHHEVGDPSFGKTWWRQENLWFNLRRNQRCLEGVLGNVIRDAVTYTEHAEERRSLPWMSSTR